MANRRNQSNFIIQGSILAAASIIVRIIGIIYRVPLTNILGNKGVGIYSIAYDVYTILLMISSYSLPLAISKLVSTRAAKGQMKNSYRVFCGALGLSVIVGILASFFTYVFAESLTRLWMSPESAMALKVLAPTLVIMSVLGVFRGYFQGLGTMVPTALSNIFEQVANAVVSIVAAKYLYDFGKTVKAAGENFSYPEAYGAAGGTLGTTIGALTALLFMVYIFWIYRKKIKRQNAADPTPLTEPYGYIVKLLAITIVPVILNTTIYNISGTLDSAFFNRIMNAKEMVKEIRQSLWGMYSGNYRLLMNVPVALAVALSSSVIPSLSASVSTGNKGQVINKINTSIRFSMIIAFPCAVGLAILAAPIITLLFPNNDSIVIPARMMQLGAVSVVLYSLSTLTNSILQGVNRMRLPVRHAFISLLIHFALISLLLYATDLNIYAVVIADVIFALVICILNAFSLRKYLGYRQEILKTFLLPGGASIIMGAAAYFSYKLFQYLLGNLKVGDFSSNAVSVIASIVVSAIVYFILLLLFKAVDEDELYKIPKGKTIVRLARKLYLLR